MKPSDSYDLIIAAQKGDREAVEELYRRYYAEAFQVVRMRLGRKLRKEMESTDIVQSVWGDLFLGLDKFEYRGELSFKRWLFTRLHQKILDKAKYFSSKKRDLGKKVRWSSSAGVEADLDPAGQISPSHAAILGEEKKRLADKIEALPDDQREALIMRWFEGYSYEEIGQRLNRSQEAARKLVGRALIHLTDTLIGK